VSVTQRAGDWIDLLRSSDYPYGPATSVGSGLQLFKNITDRVDLKLTKAKMFGCGAILLYHEPTEGTK
jgi:hypothetical protein